MIHSIFVITPSSQQVLVEKHYRGTTPRNPTHAPLPPISRTPTHAYITLSRNNLTFLAVSATDSYPLSVTQFLTTFADVLTDYFGELNEHAIKDNFVTVYELLDEMLDNGLPATLELNALKEIVPPPSMLNRVFEQFGAETSKLPLNAPRKYPWRRDNVSYANNEIFVDVVDKIDMVYHSSSKALSHLLVRGSVSVTSKLSGTPTVHLRLTHRAAFDDYALHHCVSNSPSIPNAPSQVHALSFIPPDARFKLFTYTVRDTRGISLPVQLDLRLSPNSSTISNSAALSLDILPRFSPPPPAAPTPSGTMLAHVMSATGQSMQPEPQAIMGDVTVKIPLGKSVSSVSLSPNYGTAQFDLPTRLVTWNVGNVLRGKTPTLVGNVTFDKDSPPDLKPDVIVTFTIPGLSVAGVGVQSLELGGETYKYYKGLKCITKAGTYEIRS